MKAAAFIGKFPEIAHLSKEEQLRLLEKARVEAFMRLGLSGKAALFMVGCPVLGFAIAMIPVFILGSSDVIWLFVSFMLGFLFANFSCQWLYRGVLRCGLEKVLAHEGQDKPS